MNANEIAITRVYDAPLQTVWDAWTDPEQVAKWWGPRGFTLTTHSKDLRVGGTWRYTMHGPDGTDYPNVTRYFEVEPLRKLVYDHGGTDDTPPLFRVTVIFSEVEGKTRMAMRMTLPTAKAAQEARVFIKQAGGNSTWDRLAEYLEKESSGKETFVIARSFDAPLDRMFKMWTEAEHIAQWLPPTGSTMTFHEVDIRPGGRGFFSMTDSDGMTMYGSVEYKKIEPPDCIVYTQQFRDKDGNLTRAPMMPAWPASMLTTVTLTAEGPTQTRVSVRWEPESPVADDELAAFVKFRGSMTEGWTGSFDKLEELVLRTHGVHARQSPE